MAAPRPFSPRHVSVVTAPCRERDAPWSKVDRRPTRRRRAPGPDSRNGAARRTRRPPRDVGPSGAAVDALTRRLHGPQPRTKRNARPSTRASQRTPVARRCAATPLNSPRSRKRLPRWRRRRACARGVQSPVAGGHAAARVGRSPPRPRPRAAGGPTTPRPPRRARTRTPARCGPPRRRRRRRRGAHRRSGRALGDAFRR